MRFAKLVSPSLTELFVKEIIKNILSGKMLVGQRLPNERELARMMRVSRAVINGGLAQLARMGFVDVVPRQGTFVADYKLRGTMESLHAFLEYHGGRFDPVMLDSIYEMRDNQEAHIAVLAAARRTEQDVTDLRDLLANIDGFDDSETLAEETFTFYHRLARASGNILYPMQVYSRKVIYLPLLRVVYRHAPKAERLRLMHRLVGFIEEKDADKARACILETSLWGRKIIEAHYKPGQAYLQERPA